jgi:hypothetical protein
VEDRLEHIRKKLLKATPYYSRYNPRADMMYDIEEAAEDVSWMIYEIERLRAENQRLRRKARRKDRAGGESRGEDHGQS